MIAFVADGFVTCASVSSAALLILANLGVFARFLTSKANPSTRLIPDNVAASIDCNISLVMRAIFFANCFGDCLRNMCQREIRHQHFLHEKLYKQAEPCPGMSQFLNTSRYRSVISAMAR